MEAGAQCMLRLPVGAIVRFFDAGQEAHGFIAIGQIATGVVALGQVATGVIAVGQVARGVVAIGQGAIGVFTLGMGSVGVCYAVGMIGVGGRGVGLVLPLIPSLGARATTPDLVAPSAVADGVVPEGWIEARLNLDAEGRVAVLNGRGARMPVRLDARLRRAAEALAAEGGPSALLRVTREPAGLVANLIMRRPDSRLTRPGWWMAWAAQLLGLGAVAVGFWMLVARPLLVFVMRGEVVPF